MATGTTVAFSPLVEAVPARVMTCHGPDLVIVDVTLTRAATRPIDPDRCERVLEEIRAAVAQERRRG